MWQFNPNQENVSTVSLPDDLAGTCPGCRLDWIVFWECLGGETFEIDGSRAAFCKKCGTIFEVRPISP